MSDEAKDIFAAKREAKAYLSEHLGKRVGVGIGDGRLRVYLEREDDRPSVPEQFGGFPVEVVVTGVIKAQGEQ